MQLQLWFESVDRGRLLGAAVVVMLYLAMTAWCLRSYWLRPLRSAWQEADSSTHADAARPALLVAYASQTGFAHQLARQTAQSLADAGAIRLASLQELDAEQLSGVAQAFFVVSTTGEGDAPDAAARFVRHTLSSDVALPDMRYGVLALGDREYDRYCAFGHRLDAWLRHRGAQPLFDLIEVDNGDAGALRHWQHQLSVLSGHPDLPDWETPAYQRWRLIERRLINPGSAGDPCFHLALRPADDGPLRWEAGDIAEIDPHDSATLPHREYSIASVPADGTLQLLVRQMKRPDGTLGIGSGWLTRHAAVGEDLALRIRENSSFRIPTEPRPLILIGNGTGIAGLRALLKARISADQYRNWLIFGERNAAFDRFYGDELHQWRQQTQLRLDLVFSRDQPERRYVQHRLLECAATIKDWVADGAAIYVCGSLQGMAPAVDAALTSILGADIMEQLAIDGRYRRDVY